MTDGTEEKAPTGSVYVDVMRFMRFTDALWAEARARGVDWLTWDQWDAWAHEAIRCRIVTAENLTDDDELPTEIGYPFVKNDGPRARASGLFWNRAVTKTWRRIALARVRDNLSAADWHDREQKALRVESEQWAAKAAEEARNKADAIARLAAAKARPSKNAGAAGEI
jgi:hypothetical protein